jgi:predicted transcriptional regulator
MAKKGKNISMNPETKRRLNVWARLEDRSASYIAERAVNRDWEREFGNRSAEEVERAIEAKAK